jgi:lipopolysaccharide/colanic/teichoic acid biosynthesis glycosyltransferase
MRDKRSSFRSSRYQRALKRGFDLVLGVSGLVLLWPLLALLAAFIRFSSGSPILFRQPRPGLNGKVFVICKFRTMKVERSTHASNHADEKRLTRLGRALRRTSLDELPELWNVVRGDMSIVGPRPLLVEYLPLYTKEQARRHEVRPGLTGLAQVSGRNSLDWGERFELDVWYVDNWSIWLDIQILVRTLTTVLRMDGISGGGRATMEPFRGASKFGNA